MTMQTAVPFLFVPTLHRELVSSGLLEGLAVQTVWPGLPDARGFGEGWYRPDLPYTPAQAASCLVDFSRLDEESLAHIGAASGSSAVDALARSRKEHRELAQFARTGTVEVEESPSMDSLEAHRWAQRFLLLGWLQEERALEMKDLLIRYRAGAAKLAAHLGEQVGEQEPVGHEEDPTETVFSELLASVHDLIPDDPTALLPSWRFMLDLLAVLLPPECPLFTTDARMVAALDEAGLCQEPLSESLLARLDPKGKLCARDVTCGQLPLWKILGEEPQSDKTWLDASRLLIVCHTHSGVIA